MNDRSKGDALSKGFALLQLTWFIAQIITRHAQGLSITELELTTATLAGLNSVTYIFWWSKPRDVRFPVVIRTKGAEELLAERTEHYVEFSGSGIWLRKHLWISMTTPIKHALSALRKFLVSSPEKLKNVFSNFASAIRVLLCLNSSLTQVYRHFLMGLGDLKRRKSGESQRTSEFRSSDGPVLVGSEPHSA